MSRPSDKDRLLWLLTEHGGLSNPYLKSELRMEDSRYLTIVNSLIEDGVIEKYRCRGGGLRLSNKGERTAADLTKGAATSGVSKEKDLYAPFCEILRAEGKQSEECAQIIDSSALRIRGKWSNPDVIKLSVRHYRLQRQSKLFLTTYELKSWGRWNLESVFEAASHRRFAHESYVVLEWLKDHPVEGLEYIEQACGRFGVGLILLQPFYSSFRAEIQLWAEANVPSEDETEEFLSYVLQRAGKETEQDFENLWSNAVWGT